MSTWISAPPHLENDGYPSVVHSYVHNDLFIYFILALLLLERPVYVATNNDSSQFSLTSVLSNYTTFGILCKKGNVSFTSIIFNINDLFFSP